LSKGSDQTGAMKIERIDFFQVVVPMRPETVHSAGVDDTLCAPDPVTGRVANFWEFPKWIVRLHADNGLVGLGEPRRGDLGRLLRASADLLTGVSVLDTPPENLPIPRDLVYDAFEMAWYDLIGKHQGVPVWRLLGGERAQPVPIDYWMGRCTPDDTAKRAAHALELGFQGVKMKCALGDPIAERVAAVREVAPSFSIVLDANERLYEIEQTVAVARTLDRFDGIILESPVPQQQLDWYVALRDRVRLPIALHLTNLPQLRAALDLQAANCYNLLGTPQEFVAWATIAHAAGCETWRGTGMDLGIRDMSSVHAAVAAGCSLPSDIIGNVLREDDLIVEPIRTEGGFAHPPTTPGLGVGLDLAAVECYRVAS
jgi:muconate cycloisomerase